MNPNFNPDWSESQSRLNRISIEIRILIDNSECQSQSRSECQSGSIWILIDNCESQCRSGYLAPIGLDWVKFRIDLPCAPGPWRHTCTGGIWLNSRRASRPDSGRSGDGSTPALDRRVRSGCADDRIRSSLIGHDNYYQLLHFMSLFLCLNLI